MTKAEIKFIKDLKNKRIRNESGKFIIEGEHLINECIKSVSYKNNLELLIFSKLYKGKHRFDNLNIKKLTVTEEVFHKFSDTKTPQGILGIVKKIDKVNSHNNHGKIIIALEKINDPGNLGTIIRTAYWFGVNKMILSNDCADIYNSKTIRSTQGALFNTVIEYTNELGSELTKLDNLGWDIILSIVDSSEELEKFMIKPNKNYVLVFGNESEGISNNLRSNKTFTRLRITPKSGCESLNVATSAGIFTFYFSNQKQFL